MTNEEAIEVIKQDIPCEHDTDLIEALKMAIKVLEQEYCEDAISRQAVIEQTYNWSQDEFLRTTNAFDHLRRKIKALPSVQQTVCIAKISFDEQQMKEMMDKAISNLDFSGLISRQAAIDELVRWGAIPEYNEAEKNILACCIGMLSTLPSVQPTQRTGKWIIVDDCEQFIAKCSECGRIEDSRMISKYPYCHCGAKMQEGRK